MNKMKKTYLFIIGGIIVAGGGVYAYMKYRERKLAEIYKKSVEEIMDNYEIVN